MSDDFGSIFGHDGSRWVFLGNDLGVVRLHPAITRLCVDVAKENGVTEVSVDYTYIEELKDGPNPQAPDDSGTPGPVADPGDYNAEIEEALRILA